MRKSLGQYRLLIPFDTSKTENTTLFEKTTRRTNLFSYRSYTLVIPGAAQTGFFRNIYFIYNSMNCPTTRGGEGKGSERVRG